MSFLVSFQLRAVWKRDVVMWRLPAIVRKSRLVVCSCVCEAHDKCSCMQVLMSVNVFVCHVIWASRLHSSYFHSFLLYNVCAWWVCVCVCVYSTGQMYVWTLKEKERGVVGDKTPSENADLSKSIHAQLQPCAALHTHKHTHTHTHTHTHFCLGWCQRLLH